MAATKSGSSQMYTNTRKMYAQLSCTYVCTVKHACTHARTGIGLVKAGECDGSREGKPTTQASVTEARPGIPARWTINSLILSHTLASHLRTHLKMHIGEKSVTEARLGIPARWAANSFILSNSFCPIGQSSLWALAEAMTTLHLILKRAGKAAYAGFNRRITEKGCKREKCGKLVT